jgi:hypothetical protein
MYRTLLKLLIFEVVEKVARMEGLLHDLEQGADTAPSAFVHSLRGKLKHIKESILAEKAFLSLLFAEKTAKEKEFAEKLALVLEGPYQQLCDLSKLLAYYTPGTVIPETHLFLKDVMPKDFDSSEARQVVLFHPEGEAVSPNTYALENVLLEPLSLLHKHNPLGWVGLAQGYLNQLYETTSTLESLRVQMRGPQSKEAVLRPLITHAMALRLMGPAYYYYSVIEALLRQDRDFLVSLEPALFIGLNHFNFTDKSLVILHEAIEKFVETTAPEPSEEGNPVSVLTFEEDQVGAVLRAVEKVIPDKHAFTEKHFQRSLQLQERLGRDVLLSSMTMYTPEDVYESLTSQQNEPRLSGEPFPIYDMLGMVTETPNTPREIINAGWVHKMERGPVWLYNTLNSTKLEGFERLTELVSSQDHLLIKSIETSEVHRVLLCGL